MKFSTEQRRADIVERLTKDSKVFISDLCESYGLSRLSIRNDLMILESQGLLKRIRGGAVATNKLYAEMDSGERYLSNATQKKQIAAKISELVEDNDTLMLNAGTTLTYVLQALKDKRNISIVTNSTQNAIEATSYKSFNVILLGGKIDEKYGFTYGSDAVEQLGRYHACKAIISVDGISVDTGLTLFYSNEAEVVRKIIDSSDKVIVAADSTKLGRDTFARVCEIQHADIIVTNQSEKTEVIEQARTCGIEVYEV